MYILNKKYFLGPIDFKLLKQMEENSINKFDFCSFFFKFLSGSTIVNARPGRQESWVGHCKALRCYETVVNIYQSTRCNIS
jgi:hypothetical protein